MSRFRNRFVAVFLTAFWLLATQHCGLEAAGLTDSHVEEAHGCCPIGEAHCAHDGCEIVEGGQYTLGAATKLAPPQLVLCCCSCCLIRAGIALREPESAPRARADDFGRPPDWVVVWQFVQRAALSPRAPSSGLA